MIARDAAVDLQACLESVRPLVDEMIVVDTGSSDDTVEIARSLGAQTVRVAWPDDFSVARNTYLRLARGSWILSLDADETLIASASDQLRDIVRASPRRAFAFGIGNHFSIGEVGLPHAPSEFSGYVRPGVGQTISRTVRLFPRRRGISYSFPVHESLLPALQARGVGVQLLRSPTIVHTGYLTDPRAQAAKFHLYKTLGARKIKQFPRYARGYLELGRLYLWAGDPEEAARLFSECLRRSSTCASAHYFYVLAQLWAGNRRLAARHLRVAMRLMPRNSDLLYLKGMLVIASGDPYAAAEDLGPALRRLSRQTTDAAATVPRD